MTTIQVRLPDEVLVALKHSPEQFEAELRLAAAIHWYQQGTLSQERAAQCAGMDRTDFLAELAHRHIDVFPVDFDDLPREIADAS
jgi:predicted HTH domain antitoxin